MSAKKITLLDLQARKRRGRPIVMVTAYDVSSAQLVDAAGIDVILVGDSVGMVVMGLENTVPVTVEEMLHHCRAVTRGSRRCLRVGDLPFLSYQASPRDAVLTAGRFLKEGEVDAVKLEGGRTMAPTVRAVVAAGIPVMGHIGLTPQSQSMLGGYRVQGKTAASARGLLEDALALEDAGCFAVVLELVPAPVASAISRRLSIPTIGIGAGAGCDGQVLVFHDMLGLSGDFQPRFVKRYAQLTPVITEALQAFRDDVLEGRYPAEEHTYPMPEKELEKLEAEWGTES